MENQMSPKNTLRIASKLSVLISATGLLFACHAPSVTASGGNKVATSTRQGVAITLLHHESYAICPDGSFESGLNLMDDAKSWQSFLRASSQKAPQLLEWKPNFSNARVLIFRLGSKASAGYGVRALEAKLVTANSELALYVNSSRPQPGSLNASVITAPCLIAHLASTEFNAVSVIEASDGTVLATIKQ
jgi:hypothetical protein